MTRTQFLLGPALLTLLVTTGIVLGVACWPAPRPATSTPAPVVTLVIVKPADPTVTPYVFASPDVFTPPAPTATYVPERLPVVPAPIATATSTPVPPIRTAVPTPTPEGTRVPIQKGEAL